VFTSHLRCHPASWQGKSRAGIGTVLDTYTVIGNAPILIPKESGKAFTPPAQRVLWRVYALRERGEKLPGDTVLRRSQLGVLKIRGGPGTNRLTASLIHPSGYPALGNLYDVVLLSGPHDRCGLKLGGTETFTISSGDFQDRPQVWWCVVESLCEEQIDAGWS
jgi:hypothetical protein